MARLGGGATRWVKPNAIADGEREARLGGGYWKVGTRLPVASG